MANYLKFYIIGIFLILFCHLTANTQNFELVRFSSGFVKPVDLASTGINSDERLFVVEKDGRIRIVNETGIIENTNFLNITSKVNASANERGLLGMCFHPNYSINGYFYVHYTNLSGHSTISRFKSNPTNPNIADSNSEKIILVVNQPFNNHNAGALKFGPDGYLYIGMGDGGSGGDPGNRSQNPKERLGKMLRIDVNTENTPYLIPMDNPYRNNPDTLPEIWSMGLRNPWKFSFDAVNKEIWIADVGQDNWEEVNVAPGSQASINYGWRCYEGQARFNFTGCNDERKYLSPIHTYANVFNIGCSITGGYVYRGSQFPGLFGKYIYTDFCTGKFWALYKNSTTNQWVNDELADLDNMEFATFGEDNKGELYVAGLANGVVYKITQMISSTVGSVVEKQDITIYPNPAENTILVSLEGNISKYLGFTIYNIMGQVVKKNNHLLEDTDHFLVDIDELPPGMYYLRIENYSNDSRSFVKL